MKDRDRIMLEIAKRVTKSDLRASELADVTDYVLEELGRLRAVLESIAYGEGADEESHDWPEFYESVRKQASEALK